jgi:PAS domain-containing protein
LGTWFDTVLDNIAEGVLVLDEERNIVVASSAAARLLQTPVRELMGKHREALLKELAPQFADADGFVRQLRVSPSGPYVLRAQLLTRQKRLLRWVTRPVLLGKGHGHLIVLSDVTPAPAPG